MKKHKIFRFLGMITVLTMLLAVIPAAPLFAANDVSLSPSSGKIGDEITVSGEDFTPSSETIERRARIIFAKISTTGNFDFDNEAYEEVAFPEIGYEGNNDEGEFEDTFEVPQELNDGYDTETVEPGTYYIYTIIVTSVNPEAVYIYSKEKFTVTASAELNALSPISGQAGSTVVVSGNGFSASYPVLISFDSTLISSNTVTNTSGAFSATITVPAEATAGAHVISVTVGSSVKTATYTVTASPTLNALLPTTGEPGTTVAISGSGFQVSYPVIFKFDSQTLTPTGGDSYTSTTGGFASSIIIPSDATAGTHIISVTVSTVSKQANFTVTASTTPPTTTPPTTTPPTTTPPTTTPSNTSINVVQNSYIVGSPIGIGGAGFKAGATVTIKYDGTTVATTKVDNDSTFQIIFNMPTISNGINKLDISDGTNTTTAEFKIESISPNTPPPLSPGFGGKVKSPATFEWTAVIDESAPVTYHLQIATDTKFTEDSIVFDKSGIETASLGTVGYTMTDLEELKLSSSDTPYYWRVQAIDAASNASDWTGGGEFYAAGPFKFPTWGIYIGAVVGAIIFFLLGMWMGRRTAFMY